MWDAIREKEQNDIDKHTFEDDKRRYSIQWGQLSVDAKNVWNDYLIVSIMS